MRTPILRTFDLLPGELVVDNFAGGGGASTGIEAAIGRHVDIAINHDAAAIAMHAANHPNTKHYQEDIWEVDPHEACGTRPVGLVWFSPACTHFSRAKGTQPVTNEVRGLAWVVIRWAEAVKPRIILLENVEEFAGWGPLIGDRPDPARVGETFREWLAKLKDIGYHVEFRSLVAADYGTPTIRRRLFLVARRDGQAIIWPEATHGKGRAKTWRPASEVIDWSLHCKSIFGRKRPLAEATQKRIATGIRRFILEAKNPFIVPVKSWGGGGNGPRCIEQPMRTITASKGGEFALVNPYIVRTGHYSNITGAGLREGCGAGTFRGQQLELPLGTVCATNDKNLVLPIVTKHYGGVIGHDVNRPLGAVTAKDHHAISAAFLTKQYGTLTGAELVSPVPTVTAGGGHLGAVQAFLTKFYGSDGSGQDLEGPLHTVTTKDRFGLVMIRGEQYRIVDIGMRMLQPHELFAAQGFPSDYVIDPTLRGKPLTKTDQTRLAGNSVCSQVAAALVAANVSNGNMRMVA